MFRASVEISLLSSYLKTAIRNLARHRIYSAINIIGIAIGLAFCILTYLFVHNEWTYDTFHKNADHIYRIYVTGRNEWKSGHTPGPLGSAIGEAFPDIQTVRFMSHNGKIGTENRVFEALLGYVDPNFPDIFSFSIIHGDATNALQDKYSALITEKTAQKYFNKANPVGELFPIQRGKEIQNYTITGIVQNVPNNSTLQFDVLLSFEQSELKNKWSSYMVSTFMMLPQNVHPNSLEQQFPRWTKIWWNEDREAQLKLQPLTKMHFDQNLWTDGRSNPVYTYVLSGIAILVLFIACVNFITLTLGRQATRAREVSLRKVVGAGRMQIANQFIGESLLLITIALIVGIAIAELVLPTFNTLASKSLSMSDGLNATTLAFLILLVSLVGITAGGYPAFVLSRLQPTQIMTSRLQIKTRNRFGKILVIFQFALSIFFIITTLIMAQQLTFLRTKPLGYQTENVIAIQTYDLRRENKTLPTVFRDLLQDNPSVISTTWLGHSLTSSMGSRTYISYDGSPEQQVERISIDYDLFKTLDLQLVAGREYARDFPTDAKESLLSTKHSSKNSG